MRSARAERNLRGRRRGPRQASPMRLAPWRNRASASGGEAERREEIVDAVSRQRLVDRGREGARLVDAAGQRQAVGGDRQDDGVGVRAGGSLEGPFGGLVELAEANMRHRARAQHAEQQRIEGTEVARMVGRPDRGLRIARLRLDEGQRVVAEREVRAEVHRSLQRAERLVMAAAQPKGPSHRPMRRRVVLVDDRPLPAASKALSVSCPRSAHCWKAFCQCVKDRPA